MLNNLCSSVLSHFFKFKLIMLKSFCSIVQFLHTSLSIRCSWCVAGAVLHLPPGEMSGVNPRNPLQTAALIPQHLGHGALNDF